MQVARHQEPEPSSSSGPDRKDQSLGEEMRSSAMLFGLAVAVTVGGAGLVSLLLRLLS